MESINIVTTNLIYEIKSILIALTMARRWTGGMTSDSAWIPLMCLWWCIPSSCFLCWSFGLWAMRTMSYSSISSCIASESILLPTSRCRTKILKIWIEMWPREGSKFFREILLFPTRPVWPRTDWVTIITIITPLTCDLLALSILIPWVAIFKALEEGKPTSRSTILRFDWMWPS